MHLAKYENSEMNVIMHDLLVNRRTTVKSLIIGSPGLRIPETSSYKILLGLDSILLTIYLPAKIPLGSLPSFLKP